MALPDEVEDVHLAARWPGSTADRSVVAVAQHQVGEVLDHVVPAAVDSKFSRSLEPRIAVSSWMIGRARRRRRACTAWPGAGGCARSCSSGAGSCAPPAAIRRRLGRLEEAGQGVVGIADAVVVDVVVVRALEAVAAEVDLHAVELEVVADLLQLAEAEPDPYSEVDFGPPMSLPPPSGREVKITPNS